MAQDARFLDDLQWTLPHLRRYARSLTRDSTLADDLVQDTLERAIARRRHFRTGSNLRSWTFTLMHNLHIDQCRRNRRRQATSFEETQSRKTESAPPNQLWALQLQDLARCLERLRSDEQEVLLLVGVRGLAYEEAARELGIALGTVKSRLFRARMHLREAGCAS